MRVPELLIVAFAAAAFSGCATRPQREEPPQFGMLQTAIPGTALPCKIDMNNTVACVIELTVSKPLDPLDTEGCVITLKLADNDLLTVNGMKGKYLYWHIVDSPDYIFTRDGIAFIDNIRPRKFDEGERIDGQVTTPPTDIKNKGYQWLVVNDKRRVNGYVINVREKGSNPRRCELDPWVRSK